MTDGYFMFAEYSAKGHLGFGPDTDLETVDGAEERLEWMHFNGIVH